MTSVAQPCTHTLPYRPRNEWLIRMYISIMILKIQTLKHLWTIELYTNTDVKHFKKTFFTHTDA